MIPKPTGRERAWAIDLDGKPYPVAMGKGGPQWAVERIPDIEGQSGGVQNVERHYRSFHAGYGWSTFQAPNTYHYAISGDCRYSGTFFCGPQVNTIVQGLKNTSVGVTDMFELGNYIYTLSGRYVNQITPTTHIVTASATFPATLLGANSLLTEAEVFDGNAFLANSTADNLLRFNGSTFTLLTNAPISSRITKWWGETDWMLSVAYSAKGTTCLAWLAQNSDANVAANWTGFANNSYGIGDGTAAPTSLVAFDRTQFIAKSDGLYYLEGRSGRAPMLVPALPVDTNNGVNMMSDSEGRIWYPTKGGLILYDPTSGSIADVSPGRGLPDKSGIQGLKTAIAHFRAWTYVAVYDGTDSYIMAGRQRGEDPGYGPMIWHGALVKITGTKVTSMMVTSKTDPPELWLGLLSGNIAYFRLPSNGDNPLNDSACRFGDTASLYLPADDYGLGKGHLSDVALLVDGLSGASSVQVFERRDGGSWISIGSTASNGRTVIQTTGDKRFHQCELRIDIVNAASTSTPVVKIVTGKVSRRPAIRNVIRTTLLCNDEALSRLGTQSRYSGRDLVDFLEALDEDAPVTLKDWWTGSERESTVLVTTGPYRIVKQEGDTAGGLAVDVTMKEIRTAGLLLAENGDSITTEAGVSLALE